MEVVKYNVCCTALTICQNKVIIRQTTKTTSQPLFIYIFADTWPAGDIVLEHGNSPLHIKCILNRTFEEKSRFHGKNSSDLAFFQGDHQIDPEYVSVINETTIALHIAEPPPQNEMYYCKIRHDKTDRTRGKDYEAVCLNKVVVGCELFIYL